MVSLLWRDNGKHACGGALVAPDLVLTAAHCRSVLGEALVGRWVQEKRGDDYNDDGRERFRIVSEHVHPQYNSQKFPHDLMLLKLDGVSTKQYVRLNQNATIPKGFRDELTVIGFGHTLVGNELSAAEVLQQVDITYIPNDECELSKDPQTKADYRGLVTDDMLCASDTRQDSCQGDSGGPLIVTGGSVDKDIMVGVVSWYDSVTFSSFLRVFMRSLSVII